jgi:hypothetical protein
VEDEVDKFKYKVGDRFLIRRDIPVKRITKVEPGEGTRPAAKYTWPVIKKGTILIVDSYAIHIRGRLCYKLTSRNNELIQDGWLVEEKDIDKDFVKINSLRFISLMNE